MVDSSNPTCPVCGCSGAKVARITLESLLSPDAASRIGHGEYRFCVSPDCDIVYYADPERIADPQRIFVKADMAVRVGIKERTDPRPICYCFNHSIKQIEAEVAETGSSTVLKDITERMQEGCWCETRNPSGRCCLGTVADSIDRAVRARQSGTDENGGTGGTGGSYGDESLRDCCAVSSCTGTGDLDEDRMPVGASRDSSPAQRVGLAAAAGSIATAMLSSACCWIPLLLLALGASAVGVSTFFEKYRLILLGLTGLMLSLGFYLVYFRASACVPGSACAARSSRMRRFSRVMLLVSTVVVIASAAFPKYVGYLLKGDDSDTANLLSATGAEAADLDYELAEFVFDIQGMSCEACAIRLRSELAKVAGVRSVRLSYDDKLARVAALDDSIVPLVIEKTAQTGFTAHARPSKP